ncbi:osmoprotectant transport system substrate-binding protein [Arthrobacter silviterrae]|uniref:ABC transporter substrate-binding protein n=1 Tax=Arthrobacter silviterrae TaxID=2026658 RepID=A0ABX0DIE5_9MICC|nr:ABC transporter substrate-binding protein [Arthrobacter silviterrae]MDQ0278820.1 osmoprotectant transport system substrate-binding protein [Arthrobacter silviterrae]NGN83987.1 ABC transporter substrate-binding protein [Arthrobacter silviterrae]
MTHISQAARRTVLSAAAGLSVMLAATACGGSPLAANTATGGSGAAGPLVVGSANFPESATIAEIYAGAINAAGVTATTKLNIGAREVYVKAVEDGSIDLVPDYTGNLLGYLDPRTTATTPGDVVAALPKALPSGLSVLNAAKAEDKDAMVVTAETAAKYKLTSIADLAKVCSELTLGAPPEFKTRPYGMPGLKAKYGCVPAKFTPISDGGGPLTVKALMNNDVQVADIFTTSPAIPENKLVVLTDPKNNWLSQQVVPLVKTAKVTDAAKAALNKVSALLTTEDLITLNTEVSGAQKMDPKDAAAAWLKDKGITK